MKLKIKPRKDAHLTLRLPTGIKKKFGKKKKRPDEFSVGDWVRINETGKDAVILEMLPQRMLRLGFKEEHFQLPREKVRKLSDFEGELYEEKEREYLTRSGKEELDASQREDLKKYCAKYLLWKAQYPDAKETSLAWAIPIGLCFLPFALMLVLFIPYHCLLAIGVVPEIGDDFVLPTVMFPVLIGFGLFTIYYLVTPGLRLEPEVPVSLMVYRGSRGGGGGGGGCGGCGGGGGGCGGGE